MRIRLRKRWRRFVSYWDNLFALWETHWALTWQSLGDLLPFDGNRLPDWKPKPFRPLLEPLEYRWLMSGGVTEYAAGTGAPISITTGPDNNLWYTGGNKIGKMTTSGTVTAYNLPSSLTTAYDIASDGTNLWFTENTGSSGPPPLAPQNSDGIAKITTSGTITEYTLSGGNGHVPHGIVYGPDGNIWFVESGDGYVDKFVPSTQVFTRYAVPSGSTSAPEDIVSDGTYLWISEKSANKIARVSTSGSFTEYTVPTSSSQPWGLTVASDNSIWLSEYAGNKIAHFLPSTATFIEYAIPTTSSHPEGMAMDANGNAWTVENSGNNVTEVTSLGSVLEVGIPTASSSPTDVTLGPDNLIWLTENGATQIGGDVQYIATGNNPAADPNQGLFISLGPDQATPGTGDLRASIPIDYRVAAGSGGQNAWGLLPGTDALVYNSNTADVRPIEQATMPSNPAFNVPASISASLVWNGGTPQATVTYGTTGHSPGDTYLVDQQATGQVTASADYLWAINLKASYPGQTPSATYRTVGGSAFVVSNPGTYTGYYGWALGSFGQLVGTGGGLMWIYGSGGARFYQQLTSTTFQSPSNDFGTLVKNTDGSYTYTAIDQLKYNFNSSGYLVDLVDPNGLRLTYTYNGQNEVSAVAGPDGGVTTFQYDTSNRLTTIMQAGGGIILLTPSGSNLTGATYANNSQRTFAYDATGLHHLVYDQLGSDITTVTYDSTTGVVTGVNNGGGNTASLTPQNDQAFGSVAPNASAAVGVSTDARNNVTTYTLDSSGRLTQAQLANGGVQTYTLNTAGQVTVSTDPLGHITTNTYNASGDLTQVQEPDGGIWTYQYDSTYHVVNLMIDPLGNRTTYTIDSSTGNVLAITNALNQVTTQTWQYGELHTVTNPLNQTTTYDYDSTTHRLIDMVDATGARTTYGYDAQGDLTSVENPLGRYTTNTYDGNRNLLQVNYPDGSQVSYAYNAQNQKTSETDQLGHVTAYSYNLQGWLTTTVEAAGTPIAQTIVNAYDANGNLLSETDGDGNVTSYAYDSTNRQTQVIKGYGSSAQAITTTVYDVAGNVLSVKDPLGNVTSYGYDAANRRTVEIDAYGVTGTQRTTTMTYDKAGNELSVTDPRGTVTCYQYDALNRQTTVIADRFDSNSTNLQATTTTAYDKAGNVLSTTDPIGHTTSYGYDADQRRTQEIKAFGTSIQQITATVYDAAGNTLSVTDPRGTVTSYAYDTMNRQTAQILAYGTSVQAITTTLYDSAGNTLSTTDGLGNVTSYGYDALNRQTQKIEAYGTGLQRTTSTTYDFAGNTASVTDPRGTVTCYQYDSLNRQTTIIADRFDSSSTTLQATTTTVYDKAGNVLSTTDPDGHTTSYAYNALNRQTVRIAAYGSSIAETTTTVYDAGGKILSVADPRGTVTSYAYDPMNRRTQAIQAYGTSLAATTTTVYDLAGNTLSATDSLGTVTSYGYDALNRKVTEIDGYGTSLAQTMTTVYDNANNAVETIDAQGGTTTMTYDAQNRQTSVQDPNGNIATTVYNALNKIATVDGQGDRTTYGYDALNRQVTVTNALGNVTTTVYDANDNQTAVVDADSNRTTMVYDPLNRETQMTDPLNHSGTYAYDLAGNQISATDRDGNVINSSYDALNRLTTAIWIQSGVTVNTLTYSYDGDNNQLTASNNAGTYTMAYNALNQMTSDQEPFGAVLTMTYDAVGNRTQVQDSFGGTTTDTYDALHRLATIQFGGPSQTPLRVDMTYTALNQLATMIRYSNLGGTTTVGLSAYGHDAGGRLATLQQQKGSGSTLENYTYTYDHADRVTAEILNGSATSYAYDTTNQLTTVINSSGTTTYSYDATGNRTMTGYSTGTGNELLNDGTWTYTYDANGNLTTMSQGPSANTWTYGYANNGQMLWAKDSATPGGTLLTLVTYVYDALGNRVEEDVWTQGLGTTTVTRFAYDGRSVWSDSNSANALQMRYVNTGHIDEQLARISVTGTASWYLTDRLGSVRNLTDNSGNLQDSLVYNAVGGLISESNSSAGDRYKYAQREFDPWIGLYYNRARLYDPSTGRWNSQDPLGFASGTADLYEYAGDSYTNAVDPMGLFPVSPRQVSDTDVHQVDLPELHLAFTVHSNVIDATGKFAGANPYDGATGQIWAHAGPTVIQYTWLPKPLDKLEMTGFQVLFDIPGKSIVGDKGWHWIQFYQLDRYSTKVFKTVPKKKHGLWVLPDRDIQSHVYRQAGQQRIFMNPLTGIWGRLDTQYLDVKKNATNPFYDDSFNGQYGTGWNGTGLQLGDVPRIFDIFQVDPRNFLGLPNQWAVFRADDYLVYWGRPVFEISWAVAYGLLHDDEKDAYFWFYGPPQITGYQVFDPTGPFPTPPPAILRPGTRWSIGYPSKDSALDGSRLITLTNNINPGYGNVRGPGGGP